MGGKKARDKSFPAFIGNQIPHVLNLVDKAALLFGMKLGRCNAFHAAQYSLLFYSFVVWKKRSPFAVLSHGASDTGGRLRGFLLVGGVDVLAFRRVE